MKNNIQFFNKPSKKSVVAYSLTNSHVQQQQQYSELKIPKHPIRQKLYSKTPKK